MKEHESREIGIGGVFKYITNHNIIKEDVNVLIMGTRKIYVDSNSFLHNLNGYAYHSPTFFQYRIHGINYKSKEVWEIEANRLLMLDEL